MSDYKRVLPRDLFNEALLLKCLGKLHVFDVDEFLPGLTHRHEYPEHMEPEPEEEPYPGFYITQDCDGNISVANLIYQLRGEPLVFFCQLNDKDHWPLQFIFGDEEDEAFAEGPVFTEDGKLSVEFKALFRPEDYVEN